MSTPDLVNGATSEADRQAASAIRAFCGWHIAPVISAATVTVDGSGSYTLFLPTLHLIDVLEVTDPVGTVLDPSEYTWTPAGLIFTSRRQHWGHQATATITHGFDECPPEVAAVADTLVNAGVYSIQALEAQALAPYRIPRI